MTNKLPLWPEHILQGLCQTKALVYNADPQGICPPADLCLRAYEMLAPSEVKVVLLGQDPYHTPGKANGLAFGLNPQWVEQTAYQPHSSFQNILMELPGELPDMKWDLAHWAEQGVLLLNTRLSVLEGQPMSHAKAGWSLPILETLKFLQNRPNSEICGEIVWLLWGREARELAKKAGVDLKALTSVVTSHPCQYSAHAGPSPFIGSGCFVRVNNILGRLGKTPIKWA